MKVITDSIHKSFVMIEKVTLQVKTNLVLLDKGLSKYATGRILSGPDKGKIVIYLTYDQIEIEDFGTKILLVNLQHVLCEVEPEDHEEVVVVNKYTEKQEPWLNLK